jgi:hypothetical protein
VGAGQHPANRSGGRPPWNLSGTQERGSRTRRTTGRMTALVELVDPFYAAVVFAVTWLVR